MRRIGFLGAGNMAFAIAGAISDKLDGMVIVPFDISSERIELFKSRFINVEPAASAESLMGCDAVFISVKPQIIEDAASPLFPYTGLVISIAAGIKIHFIESLMPSARVIRVMPNTPCLVGEMAAGYAAGRGVTPKEKDLAAEILNAAGYASEVDEERLDVVTGISGSGPAYFARIAEAFIDAGISEGLDPLLSRELALQTMKGTAALLQQKKMEPAELIEMVSSPNGTTVAGRGVLEASDYKDVIGRTVARTIERCKELGNDIRRKNKKA